MSEKLGFGNRNNYNALQMIATSWSKIALVVAAHLVVAPAPITIGIVRTADAGDFRDDELKNLIVNAVDMVSPSIVRFSMGMNCRTILVAESSSAQKGTLPLADRFMLSPTTIYYNFNYWTDASLVATH